MSNQQEVFALIKELSGQKNILTIPRFFIKITGSLQVALFLSQVIFWSDKGKNEDGWFYKTYEEWEEELAINKYYIRKSIEFLKSKKVLNTKTKKINGNPTLHFRLNPEALNHWLMHSVNKGKYNECTFYYNTENAPLKIHSISDPETGFDFGIETYPTSSQFAKTGSAVI